MLSQHFLQLLDSAPREEEIHQFLVDHPQIWQAVYPQADRILSKPGLDEYIPDFAAGIVNKTLMRCSWVLIEIERSCHPLITSKGNPAHELTHAVKQITDWRHWIGENIAYAQTKLPGISARCRGLVVIGRRASLTAEMSKSLQSYIGGFDGIEIRTYDWLYDIIVDNIENQCFTQLIPGL